MNGPPPPCPVVEVAVAAFVLDVTPLAVVAPPAPEG
jgi:hypothetical protein